MTKLTAISLFSGIGGIDLSFATAGFDILAQVEIDDFCRKVLTKHAPQYWPHAVQFTDVRAVGGHNLPKVDCVFGGFPCQDVSLAGKRAGISEGTRSGLWLEFARIIGELRPRCVLLENVPGILTRNGTLVIADLAALGYVGRWGIISAADAGAPHRRERWFCVAYRTSVDDTKSVYCRYDSENQGQTLRDVNSSSSAGLCARTGLLANAASIRRKRHQPFARSIGTGKEKRRLLKSQRAGVRQLITSVGGNATRLSTRLDGHQFPAPPGATQHPAEPPRVTTHAQDRAKRIKALGNAVVPQCVYPIALAIREWFEAQAVENAA